MAKKNKYRTRVESVHEEENTNHDAAWGPGWNQGGWVQSAGLDQHQNGWQNAPAHDNEVQPGDSISNASFSNANADWETAAPTPPTKDVPMVAAGNAWGSWGGPVVQAPSQSAIKGRNPSAYDGTPVMDTMQNMLSALAEQRQAQHNEVTERLQQELQRAGDLAYDRRKGGQGHSRHQRESSLGGAWVQSSEVGTSRAHSNRAASEGGAWAAQQNGAGNSWAGTGEGTSTNTKSKKKRSKSGEQQSRLDTTANNNNGGWGATGGESSWGAGGGWDSSVAAGGFGSTNNGWGTNAAEPTAGGWGSSRTDAQAPALTESHSWGAWTDAQQVAEKGKTPKSGISGFFSRIFGGRSKNKKDKGKQKAIETELWAQEPKSKEKKKGKEKSLQVQEQGKKGKILKKQKFAEPEAITWATPEDDDDDETYEDEKEDGLGGWENVDNKGGWSTNQGNGWGDPAPAAQSKVSDGWTTSPHTKTSKTYAIATGARMPEARRSRSDGHSTDHRIIESKGDGLVPARSALFSTERLARDRMFWFFDPNNDNRVSSMLEWIQYMQTPLAMFAFSKFLETKERGALFTNVEYRSPSAPREPAFDWLTFDKIQPTMDRILQESLAFYDPASQVLVFVFLLSKSRRSMAIWRRKLPLPDNIRHTYGTQITKLVASLNKQYPIHVDEIPVATPTNVNRNASNKKKWLSWGRT